MLWIAGTVASIALGVGLLSAAFAGGRRGWPRPLLLVLSSLSVLLFIGPGLAWGWHDPLAGPRGWTTEERHLASSYNGVYGGLTIPHGFGPGKTGHNPPDILEAGGYIRELEPSPDGSGVESFALYTLQGERFRFLVRPEIVPINSDFWDVHRFKLYSQCRCLVALHFTKQPVGNVAIVLFAVEAVPSD